MADDTTTTAQNEITTADIQGSPAVIPGVPPQAPPLPAAAPAAPGGAATRNQPEETPREVNEEAGGVGVEGEQVVWEARYSMKNFLGRLVLAGVLAIAWVALALYVWNRDQPNGGMVALAVLLGIGLAFYLLALTRRVILARYGHYYRLTNRRLFVSTGLFRRRRDQMELLAVKDVYTKQTLVQRFLALGTVVVVSKEPHFPILYLAGIDDPKAVMDLVWHCARSERDNRSVKVDTV